MAGPGFGAIAGVDNYNAKAGNGLGPRTQIISLSKTDISQAELDSAVQAIGAGGVAGTDDAMSIAGISAFVAGTTDVVHVALQLPKVQTFYFRTYCKSCFTVRVRVFPCHNKQLLCMATVGL